MFSFIDKIFDRGVTIKRTNYENEKLFVDRLSFEEFSECLQDKYIIAWHKIISDKTCICETYRFIINYNDKFMYSEIDYQNMSKWDKKSYYNINFAYFRNKKTNNYILNHDFSEDKCYFNDHSDDSDSESDSVASRRNYNQVASLDFGDYWPNDSIIFEGVEDAYEFIDKFEGSIKYGNIIFKKITGFYKHVEDIDIMYLDDRGPVLFNPKKIKTKKIIVSQWAGCGITLTKTIVDKLLKIVKENNQNDQRTDKEILKQFKIRDPNEPYPDEEDQVILDYLKKKSEISEISEYDYYGSREDSIVIEAIESSKNDEAAVNANKTNNRSVRDLHIVEIPEDSNYIFGDHQDTEIVIIMKKIYK